MVAKQRRVPVIGTVLRVNFSGAGQNSGEVLVVVKPESGDPIGFGIWMDTEPSDFFKLFEIAVRAMWEQKSVEVTSVPTDGLAKITRLKVVPKKRKRTA